MYLALYMTGKPREGLLWEALRDSGHEVDQIPVEYGAVRRDYDAHCVIGVTSIKVWRQLGELGARRLFWDKGYNRDFPNWWRVSAGAHQPAAYVGNARHLSDRADAQGWLDRVEPAPLSSPGKHVLIAGASPNYHAFTGLPHPTTYAQELVREIRLRTDRPIVYRPKPQWREAEAVEGAAFSHYSVKTKGHRIRMDLDHCHAMVTHGSGACLEAVLAGVPVICLGSAIATCISSTSLNEIEVPRVASLTARQRLVSNVAYCQWSLEEIADGQAWPYIMEQFQ
jgi:hypothetical protein